MRVRFVAFKSQLGKGGGNKIFNWFDNRPVLSTNLFFSYIFLNIKNYLDVLSANDTTTRRGTNTPNNVLHRVRIMGRLNVFFLRGGRTTDLLILGLVQLEARARK